MKKILLFLIGTTVLILTAYGQPQTIHYGDLTFPATGSTSSNFTEVFDLTSYDLVLSYTIDLSGVSQTNSSETSYTEVGIRQVGSSNFNPGPWNTYQGGAGGWMTSLFGDLTTNPNSLDLDDKHNLSASGGRGEADYDCLDPLSVEASPIGSFNTYGIWFDRDGVDSWQDDAWGAVSGRTYNTGGVYDIVIRYHAIDVGLGTMFATVNGIPTGFGSPTPPSDFPAGLSFKGDMTQMQVFTGNWGFASVGGNVVLTDITVKTMQAVAGPGSGGDGPGDLFFYGTSSIGNLNLSNGNTWIITLTDVDGSVLSSSKVYNPITVCDKGTGSGWESIAFQTHHDNYHPTPPGSYWAPGMSAPLLQAYGLWWNGPLSSQGFNPGQQGTGGSGGTSNSLGDVPGTIDYMMILEQNPDDTWDIDPYYRLPGGVWTLFFDGSYTTASAFDLTQAAVVVQNDASGDGWLTFSVPLVSSTGEVYVDDDWTGSSYLDEVEPGKLFGINAFATIQNGVTAVSDGGIVYTADGIYNEQVVIGKALSLIGPQANIDPRPSTGGRTGPEAVIDGLEAYSAVVRISADDVEINGFTITGGTGDMVEESGAANNLLFRYNILYDDLGSSGDEAIQIKYSDGVVMGYNYVYNILQDGLNLSSSTNGLIQHNEIHDNYSDNAAIYCYDVSNVSIIGNLVYNVYVNDGIKLGDSGDGSTGGSVSDNVVHDCAEDGITIYASMVDVDNNEIYNCSSENGAMYLNNSDNSTVTNNLIYDNAAIGLLIYDTDGLTVTGNTLYNNDDSDDTKYGEAGIWLTSSTVNVVINQNNIYNNTGYGVLNENTIDADATNNWWGDLTGPFHPTLNPGGLGNEVSDYVLFDPWCLTYGCSPPQPITTIETPTSSTCGTYFIDVTVQQFVNIGAASLTLFYDPAVFSYVDVTVNPALSAGQVNTNLSSPGTFKLGYFGPGISLSDHAVLFTLEVTLLPALSGSTTALTWSTDPNDCEYAGPGGSPIYTSTFNDLNWTIPLRPVKNLVTGLEYCTIQGAIDDAPTANGHTITVAVGIYNENVVVNKSLSLQGANYGNPCGTHGPESVVLGGPGIAFDIQSDGVEINGFEPHGMTAIRNHGYKDVAILNNQVQGDAIGIDIYNVTTISGAGLDISGNCVDQSAQIVGGNPTVGILLNVIGGSQAAVVNNNHITWPYYGYLVYNLNTTPATTLQGGTVSGVMQGVAAVNVDLSTGSVYAPSTFSVSEMIMSAFNGSHPALPNSDFHAGVYVYTGGSDAAAIIDLDVSNVAVTGTDGHKQDCAGLSFADFSTASGTLQNISVSECNLTDNENRGINIRGINALVDIDACTLDGNGYDPYGLAGNDGFGIIVREGAVASVDNCFITNPLSVNGGYNVWALYTDKGSAANATMTATSNNLNNAGNTAGYLAGNPNATLTATCNWWGYACGEDIAPLITGSVTYSPWLTGSTDGGDPGFVPTAPCNGQLLTSVLTGDATICASSSTDLSITFTGVAPFTYSLNGGTPVTTSSNPETVTVTPASTTTYTVTSLSDGSSCVASAGYRTGSATVTVNPLPVVTAGTMQGKIGSAGPTWDYLVSGDLISGLSMCLPPNTSSGPVDTYLDINTLVVNPALQSGLLNPFTLNPASLPGNWFTYWASNGVVSGATGWQGQMWQIINGWAPFFYIKDTGSDFILVDGLQYWLYGGEPILRVPSDYPPHAYTYTGTVTDVNGCESLSISVTMAFNNCDLSGTLKYNNTAQTALKDMTVTLNSTPSVSATSGTDGGYTLTKVPSGSYTVTVSDNGKPTGGINATDAAQVNAWGVSPSSIEKVRFFTGDVNLNNHIESNDALRILVYFVYNGNPPATYEFTDPQWRFWEAGDLVSANPLTYSNIPVSIGSSSSTLSLYGLCAGDFNRSYSPSYTKASQETLALLPGTVRYVEAGDPFNLPIQAGMDMEVTAASLILNLPSELFEVQEVFLGDDPSREVMFHHANNQLRVAWSAISPVSLTEGETLLTLSLNLLENTGAQGYTLTLTADPLNELADENYLPMDNAVLTAEVLSSSALGMNDPRAGELTLANRPNPFNESTTFTYNIPVNGRVTLTLYDLLGNKVKVLLEEHQNAGYHQVVLNEGSLQPGVYTASIKLDNDTQLLMKTIKLIHR